MLQISNSQMLAFKRGRLATIKMEILNALNIRFPEHAVLGEAWLEDFVRRSMDAARAVWIDDAKQIKRFVCVLFVLEYILKDPIKLQYFTQVMVSEVNAEARLLFVENNLLKSDESEKVFDLL